MSLSEPTRRDDHLGRWLCFQSNQQPALQAYLPPDLADTRTPSTDLQPISVFWLGPAQQTAISELINALKNPNDYEARLEHIQEDGLIVRLFTNQSPGGIQLPNTPGLLTAALRTREISPSYVDRFYLWAAIAAAGVQIEPEDPWEVGVNITLSDWRKPGVSTHLAKFIADTSRINIQSAEVSSLQATVYKEIMAYVADRRFRP